LRIPFADPETRAQLQDKKTDKKLQVYSKETDSMNLWLLKNRRVSRWGFASTGS
jgi:hypothetical protein